MSGLKSPQRLAAPGRQRGAASLIVVMVLLFVVSMVAAYSGRSLIFEQRTSANQHRSSVAFEAADAGMQWALAMLNSGRTTAACGLSASPTDTSFRQRYLEIDAAKGNITPKKRSTGEDLYPTCVYDGTNWTCDCPSDSAPVFAAPAGTGIFPAFRVRFRRVCTATNAPDTACTDPVQASVIHIDVNGCTAPEDTLRLEQCLSFVNGKPAEGQGRATLHAVAALRPALPAAPAAALTVRSAIDVGGASLGVFNNESGTSGLTIHSGSTVTATAARLFGPSGTPGANTIYAGDPKLAALSANRFFESTFGLRRQVFQEQPATVVIDCSATCNATTLRSKAEMNPGRLLWLAGDLALDSSVDIGTPTSPALVVVTGNVTFITGATIHGLLYSQAATWTASGGGSVLGAVVAEGSLTGTPTIDVVRNAEVLTRLRTSTGSFVSLPGSWRDFE